MTTTRQGTAPYGLERPTLGDVREALGRVHLEATGPVWADLLGRAGLRGTEDDDRAVDAIVATMLRADPVTSLVGRALHIRTSSYDHLLVAQGIMEGTT